MKSYLLKILIAAFFVSSFALMINAQTKDKMLSEITDFRQKLSKAIEKGDRKTLETLFANDFTHTHAVGKVDGKTARIDSILEGGKTLETVPPDEIEIRFYGKNTAIAVGQTTIDETVYR